MPTNGSGKVQARPGKTIYFLGQSADGPVYQPLQPKSSLQAESLFGSREESGLTRAYQVAHEEYPDADYVLVRMNGTHAHIEVDGILFDITFTPVSNESYYTDWEIEAGDEGLIVSKEIEEEIIEHHLLYRKTIAEMAEEAEYLSYDADHPFPFTLSSTKDDLPGDGLMQVPTFVLTMETTHSLSYPLAMEIICTRAGERYNSIEISTSESGILVQLPNGEQYSFSYTNAPTLKKLEQEWQRREMAQRFPLRFTTSHPDFSTHLLTYVTPLLTSDGTDGFATTADEYFMMIQDAYEMLEGVPMDVIVPLGASFNTPHHVYHYGDGPYATISYSPSVSPLTLVDEETGNPITFHEQLLEFIRTQRSVGIVTHGMLNLRPITEQYVTHRLVEQLQAFGVLQSRLGFIFPSIEGPVDEGGHISIVAQGIEAPDGWIDGTVLYAGAWVNHEHITNIPITNSYSISPHIQPTIVQELASMGIVSFNYAHRRGYVVAYGITGALPNSDWSNADHIRAVQVTLEEIGPLLDRQIGNQDGIAIIELEEELNARIESLVERRILTSGQARIRLKDNKVFLHYLPRNGLRELVAVGGAIDG